MTVFPFVDIIFSSTSTHSHCRSSRLPSTISTNLGRIVPSSSGLDPSSQESLWPTVHNTVRFPSGLVYGIYRNISIVLHSSAPSHFMTILIRPRPCQRHILYIQVGASLRTAWNLLTTGLRYYKLELSSTLPSQSKTLEYNCTSRLRSSISSFALESIDSSTVSISWSCWSLHNDQSSVQCYLHYTNCWMRSFLGG